MQGILRRGVRRSPFIRHRAFVIGRHDFPDTVVTRDRVLKLRLPSPRIP
jgi:hypothetical protein